VRRLRVTASIAAAGLVALTFVVAACGDDDNAPVANLGDGGPKQDVIVTDDAVLPPPENVDGGSFTLVDEPDTPCPIRAAAPKTLYASSAGTAISSLVAFGNRRIAQRYDGFVLLDADGSNASAAPLATSRAAAAFDGQSIVAAFDDGIGPFIQFFSATGAPSGTTSRAEGFPQLGIALSASNGSGLLVYATQAGVRGRGIGVGNFAGEPFSVAGVAEVQDFTASIARDDKGNFGVAFAGTSFLGGTGKRLAFVKTSTTARIATGYNLEVGEARRRVVQLVKRAGGYALLIEYGKTPQTHLVLLDEDGRLAGPVRRLVGSGSGFGLATSGGELGVLAMHDVVGTGTPSDAGADGGGGSSIKTHVAFRPFGANGAPLGGWVCLEGPIKNFDAPAAILGDEQGYSVARNATDGSVVFDRFNTRGN
jgi:hypothetical protein